MATELPCSAPAAPAPIIFGPCCVQTPPFRVNTQTAPALLLSKKPPSITVLPSEEMATERPWSASPTAPVPTCFVPCCVQTPPVRVNTQTAPALPLSPTPPSITVFPSEETATEVPCWEAPTEPLPTSFEPCCVQTPPLRINTQT